MASDMPLPLRAYRALSGAVTPLAGTIARQRLKRGKEDPERIDERRGIARMARPPGPLVWMHGASVGEVLAGAALVERLREMNVGILVTSGTVTSAAIVAQRFPADVIHQFVPYDSPRFVMSDQAMRGEQGYGTLSDTVGILHDGGAAGGGSGAGGGGAVSPLGGQIVGVSESIPTEWDLAVQDLVRTPRTWLRVLSVFSMVFGVAASVLSIVSAFKSIIDG